MTEKEKREEKRRKAYMRASVEMMKQAEDAVRDKYSKYEGTEDKMEDVLGLIDESKNINLMSAQAAGYTENDLKDAEYTKPNGLEVEKYQKHLEKLGVTDEQIRDRGFGGSEGVSVIASSNTKEKEKKGFFSFLKKNWQNKDEVITDINPMSRSVIGEGYDTENQKVKSSEEIMKELSESFSKRKKEHETQPNEEVESKNTETTVEQVKEKNAVLNKEPEYELPKVNYENDSNNTFDYSSIPDYVQYDIIPLPSKGECYPHKKSRIPVRYLTAADENLIASPNMYAGGKLVDVILRRCVLDKDFNTDEMCMGDRDAVVLWLRATGYGPEYPLTVTNPENGKAFDTTVNLGDFKDIEFNLKGDENGWFAYKTQNNDEIKFKFLSKKDLDEVFNDTIQRFVNNAKIELVRNIDSVEKNVASIEANTGEHDEVLSDAIDYIKEWIGKSKVEVEDDDMYTKAVTENMIKYTMSVNGNSDREYIRNFVENMRAADAKAYRNYVAENKPGVDLSIEVPLPESEGGGSFKTFLTYGETVFINVAKP